MPEELEDKADEIEKQSRGKLTDEQREDLKQKIRDEVPTSEISEEFGISPAYIYVIKTKMRQAGEL